MCSQTVVTELLKGDKVQLYLYTSTGILDKAANHLTQFAGVLLRPGILTQLTATVLYNVIIMKLLNVVTFESSNQEEGDMAIFGAAVTQHFKFAI